MLPLGGYRSISPSILQVLCRQARQQRFIDRILAKCRLILFKAKAPQPTSNVHDDAPTRSHLV
jgi:hypothetical protein